MKKMLKQITPCCIKGWYRVYRLCCRLGGPVAIAKELSKETGIPCVALLFDINLSVLFGFVSPYEYKMYRFYDKNRRARDRFLTEHRTAHLVEVFNRGDLSIMSDKQVFNRYFSDFIGRQWLYAPNASDQQIEDFLDVQKQVILKPNNLYGGTGIRKILRSDVSDIQTFCDSARKDCLLLEEIVKQHPDLDLINPASVNTIRITTVIDRAGIPHLLTAGLRMGSGQTVTDNLSVNGIFAQIDLDTGVLFTLAIGADLRTYVKHPISGVILPGFQIPHWEAIKEMVIHATKLVPQIRWVGWDIAVTEKGPLLIEGNAAFPAPRIMQFATQKGVYYTLRGYL